MSLHPDDPRLTAYLLGELSADEAAAVAQALAADPALRGALEELAEIQRELTESLVPGPLSLHPAQRTAILRAARPKARQPWRMPLAAAAAVVLAALVFSRSSDHGSRSRTAPPPAATVAATEAPAPTPAASPDVVIESPATALTQSAGSPTLALPVHVGQASLGKIRDAIRTEHCLPPHDAVRLEEILNRFALTPNGLTAVARHPASHWHPDDRSTGTTSHAASLATESLVCPWKPSASLVLITLRGNPFSDCEITAAFRANPANTRGCRLLGFAPDAGQPPTALPTRLAAKASTSLVLEVEPATASGELGTLEWTVNGEPAAPVVITRRGDAEPSDDARFAALICTFSQWLAGDAPGMINADLLAALARESATTTLPAERADFLQLIDQALGL